MKAMRKIYDIPGGIHPLENKVQSTSEPIMTPPLPEQLIFPVAQHIGAPAKVCVTEGDRVLKGQVIAKADGYMSAPIHASTSGTIKEIGEYIIPTPSGLPDTCIILKPDGKEEWIELEKVEDYTKIEKSVLLDKIAQAGIVGMGGAGFPAAVKLNPRPDCTINTLIINGAECEPYITADDMLMRTNADTIVKGAQLLAYLLDDPREVLIGVEDNKPEGITALQQAAKGTNVDIVVFPTKYPSGGEKQLIQILTGREVPSGGIPADMGTILQNMGTTVAAYEAITKGIPLLSRIVTVTGQALKQPRNYQALIGTPYSHLLKLSGFNETAANRIICGGPMMGYTVESIETPVIKSTNCILVPTHAEMPANIPAQACIRCGICAEACPATLLPQQLYWYSQAQDYDKLTNYHLMDCIECGCCSYVCPSSIPLVQYFRASKGEIRSRAQEQVKADLSRKRFEAKQARIEREEAEKAARQAARKRAAEAKQSGSSPDDSYDPIKAAMARVAAQKTKAEKSPEEQRTKLENAIAAAKDRVVKSAQRLSDAEANGDTAQAQLDKLKAAAENAQVKLATAEKKLADFQTPDVEPRKNVKPTVDPAQAAIDRAQAAAAAKANMSQQEKLESSIKSMQERINKAQAKLEQARAEQSEHVPVLEQSLTKLKEKLASAEQELDNIG